MFLVWSWIEVLVGLVLYWEFCVEIFWVLCVFLWLSFVECIDFYGSIKSSYIGTINRWTLHSLASFCSERISCWERFHSALEGGSFLAP